MSKTVNREMKASWNDKANFNAYHWVDSTEEHWDKTEYYKRGAGEATKYIIDPLLAYGFSFEQLRTMKVLDIGCGTGRLVRFISGKVLEITGIDISKVMIDIAESDNSDIKNANFVIGNGTDLSLFNDSMFDLVYSFIVFQHIPERKVVQKYIEEMFRVVNPGGCVRFQVRGYPGNLRVNTPSRYYKGFNKFYTAIHFYKGILPIPVIRRYNTVYGAFFKKQNLESVIDEVGFRKVEIVQDPENHRYLWVTAQK